MATNFVQEGENITYTLGSGETSTAGHFFQKGNLRGIADRTGVEGTEINVATSGVWRIGKTTGTAWTVGLPIYWIASTGKGITTDESGTLMGFAAEAAASGDTEGEVKLLGSAPAREVSYSVKTIATGTTGAIADARVTATSHPTVTWLTNTTASGSLLVALDPGVGYTITVRKPADATLENTAAGTVSVKFEY